MQAKQKTSCIQGKRRNGDGADVTFSSITYEDRRGRMEAQGGTRASCVSIQTTLAVGSRTVDRLAALSGRPHLHTRR
jgi:hypothetical protein